MLVTAGQNLITAKPRSKEIYDLKSRNFKPRIEDYVRIITEPRTNNTVKYYREPCKVIQKLLCKNILIALSDGRIVRKRWTNQSLPL